MPVPWKCYSLSKVNPFLFFLKCMMTRSPCSWWWLNRETNNNFVLILSAKTNNYNISLKKKRLWNTRTKISHGKISLSRFFWFSKLVRSLHADRRTCHTRPTIDFLKKLHVLSISRIKTVCDRTVWHKIFAGCNFCDFPAIRKNKFPQKKIYRKNFSRKHLLQSKYSLT